MNKEKKMTRVLYIVLFSILTVVFSLSFFAIDYFKKKDSGVGDTTQIQQDEKSTLSEFFNRNNEPKEDPKVERDSDEEFGVGVGKSVEQIEHTVWIPVWDSVNGINSLRKHSQKFSTISPVWYSLNSDGTLIDRRNASWTEIVSLKGNAKVYPSIAISNADILHEVLANPSSLETHISSIVVEVERNGYDGFDIDYEMIYLKDKELFKYFIEQLAVRLNSNGKKLSVTLLPKWGDDVTYSAFPETREVQDYAWVGSVADEVRIMTYDYTSSGSKEAGPIAPIAWMENVLKYAVTEIPREKLILGIHLYGYEWGSDGRVSAKTYSQVEVLSQIANYQYAHDSTYGEGVSRYTCQRGGECTLYFQDIEGVRKRIELAAKYGIKGVAYWRLGGEGILLD